MRVRKLPLSRGFTLVEIMIVIAIIGVIVALAIPNFLKTREHARKQICIENIGQIESAKQLWGLENGKKEGDIPEEEDLIGPLKYIKVMPLCPGAGSYNFRAIGEPATCTIAGHAF